MLRFGQPVTLDFRLLKDVDAVTVAMSYANQSSERRVLLEKDATANIVTIQSSQFSQEGDLGRAGDLRPAVRALHLRPGRRAARGRRACRGRSATSSATPRRTRG